MTAGFGGKLGHVKSFGRQCEMIFNDDIKFVDDHFDIQYGNIYDRIYITSDGPTYYICKTIVISQEIVNIRLMLRLIMKITTK